MFDTKDVLNAYQDTIYRGMRYRAETRIGSRSIPIVGGFFPP